MIEACTNFYCHADNKMATQTSYEPTRCSPYGSDLHWRMIYQYMALDLSYCVVAENLGVNASTIC